MVPTKEVRCYEFSNFQLDLESAQLIWNGEEIPLAHKSFLILLLLIGNRERVISKEEILSTCWDESHVEETTLIQHIYRIRKALEKDKRNNVYIRTISKKGYRFVAETTVNTLGCAHQQTSIKNGAAANGNVGFISDEKKDTYNEDISHAESYSLEEQIHDGSTNHGTTFRKALFGAILAFFALLSVFGIYSYYSAPSIAEINHVKSIAVLPFKQIGEGRDDKFGLGIADTIISRLGNQNKIAVSPTSTITWCLMEHGSNPIEIGEKLAVEAVLTGTTQVENGKVRVNLQLISVRKRSPLWTDRLEEEFSDVFSLQDHISKRIAFKLGLESKEEVGRPQQ